MIKNVTFGEQNTILHIKLHFKKWESKEPSIFLLEYFDFFMLTVFQGVKLGVFMILNLFYNVNFLKMWLECIAVAAFSSIYFTQAWCSFKSYKLHL